MTSINGPLSEEKKREVDMAFEKREETLADKVANAIGEELIKTGTDTTAYVPYLAQATLHAVLSSLPVKHNSPADDDVSAVFDAGFNQCLSEVVQLLGGVGK